MNIEALIPMFDFLDRYADGLVMAGERFRKPIAIDILSRKFGLGFTLARDIANGWDLSQRERELPARERAALFLYLSKTEAA